MKERPFSKAESLSPDGQRQGSGAVREQGGRLPVKTKLCSALFFLAALIGLLTVPAWASETDNRVLAGGECGAVGNDVTWTLYRDGRFVVRGAGKMYDYAGADSLPWYDYRDQITSAVIESGVTGVGNNAFRTCGNLASVTLPDTLERIGNVAFYQCNSLAEVKIPNSVTEIGSNAFGYCALKEVTIPANVAKIGDGAFFKCSALTAINVNAENKAYSSQGGILFDKVAGEGTGSGDSVTPNKTLLIWYPSAKTGDTYTVPDGITKIGPYAFQGATNLTKVTLPEGVTEIDEWAFSYNPKLISLVLPLSLQTIKSYAFYECTGLSKDDGTPGSGTVEFAGSRQQWSALSVKIGDGNYRLTNAKIDCKIGQDNVVASGECGALGSNATWSLNDKGDFSISGNGAMLNFRSAASVPWSAYDDGSGGDPKDLRPDIKTVTIEGSVTRDADGKIIEEKNITNIGDYAFYDCVNLTELTVLSTLKAIGANAFSDCPALTKVDLSKSALESVGDYAFNGAAALTKIEFPGTLKTIGKRAFLRSALTSVTIPASVESVGEWAFRWCDKLTAFTMEAPEEGAETHYTSIGDYAVADCAALESVSFTENLTLLGEYALSRDVKLTSVSIPASVSGIGSCAFYGCTAMEGVTVSPDNQSYCSVPDEKGMLLNKDQTCIFYYPIGRSSPSCAISDSVTSVAAFAFDGVKKLTDVYYGGNQAQWDTTVKPNIGSYNDPLLKATLHAEGLDPNDISNITSIDEVNVEETEEGRTAVVKVQCGENALGAEALCAVYDKNGRFLGVESKELSPGTDDEISFALANNATSFCLFVWDGDGMPRCPSQTHSLEESNDA